MPDEFNKDYSSSFRDAEMTYRAVKKASTEQVVELAKVLSEILAETSKNNHKALKELFTKDVIKLLDKTMSNNLSELDKGDKSKVKGFSKTLKAFLDKNYDPEFGELAKKLKKRREKEERLNEIIDKGKWCYLEGEAKRLKQQMKLAKEQETIERNRENLYRGIRNVVGATLGIPKRISTMAKWSATGMANTYTEAGQQLGGKVAPYLVALNTNILNLYKYFTGSFNNLFAKPMAKWARKIYESTTKRVGSRVASEVKPLGMELGMLGSYMGAIAIQKIFGSNKVTAIISGLMILFGPLLTSVVGHIAGGIFKLVGQSIIKGFATNVATKAATQTVAEVASSAVPPTVRIATRATRQQAAQQAKYAAKRLAEETALSNVPKASKWLGRVGTVGRVAGGLGAGFGAFQTINSMRKKDYAGATFGALKTAAGIAMMIPGLQVFGAIAYTLITIAENIKGIRKWLNDVFGGLFGKREVKGTKSYISPSGNFKNYTPSTWNAYQRSLSNTAGWPVKGKVESPYGLRKINGKKQFHNGVDIPTASNTTVFAPIGGRIIHAQNTGDGGGQVKMRADDGTYRYFNHLSGFLVSRNQEISAGQPIGYSGGGKGDPMSGKSTGPHLDYKIQKFAKGKWKFVNPEPYMGSIDKQFLKSRIKPEAKVQNQPQAGVIKEKLTQGVPTGGASSVVINNNTTTTSSNDVAKDYTGHGALMMAMVQHNIGIGSC